MPGFSKWHLYRRDDLENMANGIARVDWGDQSLFWYNFIVSVLRKADGQVRSRVANSLILSNIETGSTYQVELLLGLVSGADDSWKKGHVQKFLLASIKNVETKNAYERLCAPKASTCLEAVVNWMETEGIEAQHLTGWGFNPTTLLCPQADPSLKRVIGFLLRGGRSLSQDYGANVFLLKGDATSHPRFGKRKLREVLLRGLVDNGCDVNLRDNHGHTMLWYTTDVLHALIDCGARLENYDENGNTILHRLVHGPNKGQVKELLEHEKGKALVNMCNKDGLTAYHVALGIDSLWDWMGFTGLLLGSRAKTNMPIPNGAYRDQLVKDVARWKIEVGGIPLYLRNSAEKRWRVVEEALRGPRSIEEGSNM
ncbi:hypothetical protein EsH8_VII_000826 [Colletotrichum jinshuiense]